jgi:hypothetical protein
VKTRIALASALTAAAVAGAIAGTEMPSSASDATPRCVTTATYTAASTVMDVPSTANCAR